MTTATITSSSTPMLTGQQRVGRMFERRDHDRVPRHDTFWAETIERWQNEGLVGDASTVHDMLGSDFHGLSWVWPCSFPEQRTLISADAETRVIRDGHGKTVRYWKERSGTPEHLGFDCDSAAKWHDIYKPAMLAAGLQVDPAAIARRYDVGRSHGRWCHLNTVEPFEQTRAMMGDEITLMAMAEDPEWVIDVARTFTTQVLRNLDAAMATGIAPDGLWVYGDMAFNHATMCSPKMYRELIWPQHKRLADWAHAHEMKVIFHTDGDVNGVLELYVEAGFDCLQPLEAKANMDVRRLAPTWGERLAMFGNIDVMIMGTNDRERIEHEIASKFAAAMPTRGYAYHSDHSVPPTVAWETYQFIMQRVEHHGRYQ